MNQPIRIVVAEDQGMVLGAFAALLELEDDLQVVAVAHDGERALAAVREHQPDVLITDIEMPGKNGLDVALELKGSSSTRVVIVTSFGSTGYLRRAFEAGACAFLLKSSPAEELVEAVRRVHRGERVVNPEFAAEALSDPDPLTERERQVLRLAGEGFTTAEISKKLALGEGTVRNYLSEAIGKLGAANRVEAARLARSKGWL